MLTQLACLDLHKLREVDLVPCDVEEDKRMLLELVREDDNEYDNNVIQAYNNMDITLLTLLAGLSFLLKCHSLQ